ncbi:MAG: hypothetical protein AAGD96_26040, partial [Chloroflexota bacterium]
LVEGELTRVVIPSDSVRFFLDTLSIINNQAPPPPEYVMDVTVKHPILFPEEQQIVTVEVFDRVSNQPAEDLLIAGSVYFNDPNLLNNEVEINFEPTALPGTYTATIELPAHPEGKEGREVIVDVSFRNASSQLITTIKTFQTWW